MTIIFECVFLLLLSNTSWTNVGASFIQDINEQITPIEKQVYQKPEEENSKFDSLFQPRHQESDVISAAAQFSTSVAMEMRALSVLNWLNRHQAKSNSNQRLTELFRKHYAKNLVPPSIMRYLYTRHRLRTDKNE